MSPKQDALVLTCRYRLATGCEAKVNSRQALQNHHNSAAHADDQVTLTACPVCGTDFGGEQPRAVHLSIAHGIAAQSQQRLDLDARQVADIFAAQDGPVATFAGGPPAPQPSSNGHRPPPEGGLSAGDVIEELIAAVRVEVAGLRARNAQLEERNEALERDSAVVSQFRTMLLD
jgi:hypothetical protein